MIQNYMHLSSVINHIFASTDIVYISSIFTIHHYIVIILEIDATDLTLWIFLLYKILWLSVSIKIAEVALVSIAFTPSGNNNIKNTIIFFIVHLNHCMKKRTRLCPFKIFYNSISNRFDIFRVEVSKLFPHLIQNLKTALLKVPQFGQVIIIYLPFYQYYLL